MNTKGPYYNELIIKNKKNMLHKLVYNKEFCIQNISLKLYEQMKKAKTICLVGNGPVETNHSEFIDSCDFVIRFNNYSVDTNPLLVGKKTNLQINCLMGYSIFNSWIRDSDFILPMESLSVERYKELFMSSYKHPNLILPPMKMIYLLKSFSCDYTRGFYGISMCLQIKKNINPDLQIYIYGFGGKGHHYNKKNIMHHNHLQELDVIKSLQKNNTIIHLDDIRDVPIVPEITEAIEEEEIPIIPEITKAIEEEEEIPIVPEITESVEEEEIPIVPEITKVIEEEKIPIIQSNPMFEVTIKKNKEEKIIPILQPYIKPKIPDIIIPLNNKPIIQYNKKNNKRNNKKNHNKKIFKTGKDYLNKHRNRNK